MTTYLFDNSKNLVDIDSSGNKYGFDEVKNRLLFSYQEGIYGVDEYKNFIEIKPSVGDTITVDGIDVLVIATLRDGTWVSDIGAKGTQYIVVDKNHDLSYYFTGSDYVDESESPTVINTINKYGYEWGGYNSITGITATSVGSGLSNTNSLIEMNLQPNTSDWYVVWNKIKEFRETHSDNWFLPSKDELNLIYEARANLSNLTTINDSNKGPFYWSSSENSSVFAWYLYSIDGELSPSFKFVHYHRYRLCRML